MLRRFLAHRLGRRGAFLLLFGIVYLIFGWSLTTSDPTPDRALVFGWLPDSVRAGVWFLAGAAALVFAWRRGPGQDTPGFIALILPPIIRGGSFAWSFLVHQLTDGADGYARGWSSAAVWAAVIGVVLIIASWPEPNGYAPSDGSDKEDE